MARVMDIQMDNTTSQNVSLWVVSTNTLDNDVALEGISSDKGTLGGHEFRIFRIYR